jgi:multiple sugar transport system permease protein
VAVVLRRRLLTALTYAALLALTAVVVLPLMWMLDSSLRTLDQMITTPFRWWTWPLHWVNYPDALRAIPFLRQLANTAFLSVTTAVGTTASAALAAYAFARLSWPGRNVAFWILLATIFLPGAVTLVPQYIIFHDLGLLGTYWPLILPACFAPAFSVFLLRQFFMTVPATLSEAAKIDGASEWQIFARVILPASQPALGAVAVLSFVGAWTDYLAPLIYLNNLPQDWTLSVGLDAYLGLHSANWNLLMAASVVFIIPLILVFFFSQSYFLRGIQLSADVG